MGGTYYNAEMETMPAEALLAWQGRQVARAVAHAYAHAPAMRRIMDEAGVPPADVRGVDDLARIPITRKDELIAWQRADPPFGGFLAVPPGEVKRFFLSPGPLFDPEGRGDDYWRWAPALYAAGFRPGDIVQNTAAYHRTPLGFMFDEALRAIGCAVVPTGPGDTETQLQMIRELDVTGYVGVPSYLMTLIERAEEKGWAWTEATRLRKAFLAAEPFPPSLQEAFRARGISFGEGYGTAETGNLGYACGHSPGWHLPYDVVVQVVDLNSGVPLGHGEEGEIVATLFDETYALIRFGTGDLSALDTRPCPCGRTTARLTGWLGRVGQAVKVRGMFVHPRQLAQVLGAAPRVTRYRAIVSRAGHRDQLTVQVEGDDETSDVAPLAAALQEVIKVRADVVVVPAGTIPEEAPVLQDERTWE